MESRSLTALAGCLPEWQPLIIHPVEGHALRLVNATVKTFDFDTHDTPETLISVRGAYAIETPAGRIETPEGAAFTVPPGVPHHLANAEDCVILVLR